MREVYEETGVKTAFSSILGFREVLNFKFGQADIYFVCMLTALDEKIDIQMPDEVARAEWKDFVRNYVFNVLALLKTPEIHQNGTKHMQYFA